MKAIFSMDIGSSSISTDDRPIATSHFFVVYTEDGNITLNTLCCLLIAIKHTENIST